MCNGHGAFRAYGYLALGLAVGATTSAPRAARAAFALSGPVAIERFDGTSKDLATWQQLAAGGSSITQNNEVTFASGPFNDAEYTTRNVQILVGQFARTDIRVNATGPAASGYLALTTNNAPDPQSFFFDSYSVSLQFGNNGAASGYHSNGSGFGQGFPLAWPNNTKAVLEIIRDTPTQATFNVYDAAMTQVVHYAMSVPAFAGPLYIGLTGGGSDGVATFDNVTIPAVAAPEPASFVVVGSGGLVTLALRRERRHRRPL